MIDQPAIVAIFALTYLGIAVGRVPGLKLDRTGIVILGAIAVMVFSGLPTAAVIGLIDWPTILLLFGFFVLSAQLRLSGLFDAVALAMARRSGRPARFLAELMLVTAGLSAFLNHDIVCLVFTPIVATVIIERRLDPAPFLIALALASNIGAAATLVGNPQGMMIAQVAGLDFGHYALWCLPPVALALAGAYATIWLLSRRQLVAAAQTPSPMPVTQTPLDRPHTAKGLLILGVVVALFFSPLPKELVALTAAGFHLASPKFRTEELLGLVDWPILLLFIGLFVVTGALHASGFGVAAIHGLAAVGLDLQSLPTLALVTAALANLVNNSAAVLLLLRMADVARPPAAYVLALASAFGGSLLIASSVSNIIVVHKAREMGVPISLVGFVRLGLPVTLVALAGLIGWVLLAA